MCSNRWCSRPDRTLPLAAHPPNLPAVPELRHVVMDMASGLQAAHLARLLAHTQLTYLQLSFCGVKQLPTALRALGGALRHLDLSGNWLQDSLKPLGGLTSLTSLYLGATGCQGLPAALSALTALKLLVRAVGGLCG